ncbi:MAG TPA: MlaD family protein, partial [Gemmatales bacterium]|nr:MlaD family protein [Gemmatales bacterium]
ALRKQFTGASEPLLPDEPGDLQVILQHKHSGRLQPGLPVLHRVVKVGQVVSSELAGDASAVEIHIRIHPPYRSLVRSNSKFWNSSGVKLNLDGLQMENLVTVVFGGLTFATPPNPGNPVADGKRFWQEDKEPDGWKDWNPSIPLISPNLPEGMNPPRLVRAVPNYKVPGRIYGTSAADQRGLVLPVGDDWLLGPAELLNKPLKAIATEPATVSFEGISLEANPASENAGQLVWLKLTGLAKNSLPKDRLRAPEKLEPCVLVSDAISESVFITENHLEETQVGWLVRKNTPASMLSREAWHGAAAVSTRDGKVIGIFLFSEKSNPHIVPLTKELTNW